MSQGWITAEESAELYWSKDRYERTKSFSHKVQKELPEFVAEVSGLSVQDLDNRLVTLTKGLAETEQAKEQDLALEETRALVSELSAPYRDAKKVLNMKIKYIIGLINGAENE